MDRIKLHNVLPQVFAMQKELSSDVWRQDVVFERGKTYLVEADSGKGKSTFCSYLLGYRSDYSGQLLFDDENTKNYSIAQWTDTRRRHVSHLFQELRLFPELTAFENVMIKNNLTGYTDEEQIKKWFEQLGIVDKLNEKIGRMSFGQQQRVALIRSLVQPYEFLIVDEPISHLDDANAAIMGDIITTETKRQGAALIVTSIGKHINFQYDKILNL